MEGENKIKAAMLSIGRIDDPAEHGIYGYWHRNDHMAEMLSVPGVAVAQRTVATPACLRARVAESGGLAGAQYFTYYLLTEPLETALQVIAGGTPELFQSGRMRMLSTPSAGGIFRLAGAYKRPELPVSVNAVPFLPHTGVFLSVVDAPEGAAGDELPRHFEEVRIPDMLSVKHVTGCYWFRSWPEAVLPGVDASATNRHLQIFFLDGDPIEMVHDLHWRAEQWRAAGREHPAATPLLAGPFELSSGRRFDWFD